MCKCPTCGKKFADPIEFANAHISGFRQFELLKYIHESGNDGITRSELFKRTNMNSANLSNSIMKLRAKLMDSPWKIIELMIDKQKTYFLEER